MQRTRKELVLLWAAQGITAAGDAIYQIALVWLILDITGSAAITGLVATSAYLPALIFGLWAGVASDRFNRMKVMIFSQASQALTVALIPIMIWNGWEQSFLIGCLAFLRASFGTLFPPALNALVPQLVPPDVLVKTNSILSTSSQLAYLLGPALAGMLLKFVTVPWLFILDGLSFVVTLFLLLGMKRPETTIPSDESHSLKELREGFRYLKQNPAIGFMLGLTIVNNLFIMGPAIVGMPVLVKEALHGSATQYAFVEALMALGMLIGSALVYTYLHRMRSGSLLLLGMVLDGLTYSLFYSADTVSFVMIMIVIHGIGIPMIVISRTALIQKHVPNSFHGRLFSMVHLSVMGVTALSSALTGIVASLIDIQTVFLGIGIGAAACGVIGFFHTSLKTLE